MRTTSRFHQVLQPTELTICNNHRGTGILGIPTMKGDTLLEVEDCCWKGVTIKFAGHFGEQKLYIKYNTIYRGMECGPTLASVIRRYIIAGVVRYVLLENGTGQASRQPLQPTMDPSETWSRCWCILWSELSKNFDDVLMLADYISPHHVAPKGLVAQLV